MLHLVEQSFEAPIDILDLRENEKWSYARDDFWLFRQCIHPGMITGWWPASAK
jgi:hypothetical protein